MKKRKFNINVFQRAGAKDRLKVQEIDRLEYQDIIMVRTNFGKFYLDDEMERLYYSHKDCVFGYSPILQKSVWEVIASAMDEYCYGPDIDMLDRILTEQIKTRVRKWQ